jgi:LCP family protein required for cell wall assembly
VTTHRTSKVRRRIFIALGITLALVLVAGGGVYIAYRNLNSNITTIDVTTALGSDRPTEYTVTATPGETNPPKYQPVNILLIGTDTRSGTTEKHGVSQGLSDTTILLHLSADRSRAYAVSIPRDSMVQRPPCQSKYPNGGTVPGALAMFNSAYSYGGPACTIKTVEQLTHIRIDHFVIVDFQGFKDMVNALGGVKICVPTAVNDTTYNMYLKAGTYNMDGKTALMYVRERHNLSVNGDIGRVKRQQVFLAAMTKKVISAGTLLNPLKLYNFLDAATKSVTTDPGLGSVTKLGDLALQLQNIGLSKIQFMTIPVGTYRPDPNRVQWVQPISNKIWNAIRTDKVVSKKWVSDMVSADENVPGTAKTKTTAKQKQLATQYGLCS